MYKDAEQQQYSCVCVCFCEILSIYRYFSYNHHYVCESCMHIGCASSVCDKLSMFFSLPNGWE